MFLEKNYKEKQGINLSVASQYGVNIKCFWNFFTNITLIFA
jgi:hypothetical protein